MASGNILKINPFDRDQIEARIAKYLQGDEEVRLTKDAFLKYLLDPPCIKLWLSR